MEDPAVSFFLDRVRAWLKATNDPRLVVRPDGSETIIEVAAACADFCEHMAREAERAERS